MKTLPWKRIVVFIRIWLTTTESSITFVLIWTLDLWLDKTSQWSLRNEHHSNYKAFHITILKDRLLIEIIPKKEQILKIMKIFRARLNEDKQFKINNYLKINVFPILAHPPKNRKIKCRLRPYLEICWNLQMQFTDAVPNRIFN